jgi:hypothetical protein
MEAFVPKWGQCTSDINISTMDDQQAATATENRGSAGRWCQRSGISGLSRRIATGWRRGACAGCGGRREPASQVRASRRKLDRENPCQFCSSLPLQASAGAAGFRRLAPCPSRAARLSASPRPRPRRSPLVRLAERSSVAASLQRLTSQHGTAARADAATNPVQIRILMLSKIRVDITKLNSATRMGHRIFQSSTMGLRLCPWLM